jgi:uncharacterized protein (DUF433 family)
LEPRPKSVYRQLFLKGTRIRAEAVYAWTIDGDDSHEHMTPDQVATAFGLPVEAVREAIAYCQAGPSEIDEDHRREEILLEATGMNAFPYKWNDLLSPEEIARIRQS